MSDGHAERLTEYVSSVARERRWPNQRPRDAATLIVIDRGGAAPKVLMGKRHHGHKFMPGKFVFPGGRIEADDRRMPAEGALPPPVEAALIARTVRPSPSRGRALALTAIRETYEETGLMIGRRAESMPAGPRAGSWASFFERGILPDLGAVHFIGRAITPPRRPKRFDTRFFAIDREAIALEEPGFVGPDKELVELLWVEVEEAMKLDLPPITVVMLQELERRAEEGFGHELPVPFYYERQKRFVRELLGPA
ncbi:NUDIX hydrolase [Enterovirga aerilata]|uniref:NUDIX hydrolase n=1 Tax=Enterovirga aerilata TaxID=2730920 RepID=UPI003211DC14